MRTKYWRLLLLGEGFILFKLTIIVINFFLVILIEENVLVYVLAT